jgi:hypothetical protein
MEKVSFLENLLGEFLAFAGNAGDTITLGSTRFIDAGLREAANSISEGRLPTSEGFDRNLNVVDGIFNQFDKDHPNASNAGKAAGVGATFLVPGGAILKTAQGGLNLARTTANVDRVIEATDLVKRGLNTTRTAVRPLSAAEISQISNAVRTINNPVSKLRRVSQAGLESATTGAFTGGATAQATGGDVGTGILAGALLGPPFQATRSTARFLGDKAIPAVANKVGSFLTSIIPASSSLVSQVSRFTPAALAGRGISIGAKAIDPRLAGGLAGLASPSVDAQPVNVGGSFREKRFTLLSEPTTEGEISLNTNNQSGSERRFTLLPDDNN